LAGTPTTLPPVPSQINYAPSQGTKISTSKSVFKDFLSTQGAYSIRNFVWYFIFPIFIIYIFTPGFLISIPAVPHCDSKETSNFTPSRVTWANVFIHTLVIWGLIVLHYYIGAKAGFSFPFLEHVFKSHLG
jgi:hypothetical protein